MAILGAKTVQVDYSAYTTCTPCCRIMCMLSMHLRQHAHTGIPNWSGCLMLVDNLRMLDAYVGTYGCAGCLFTLDGLRISAQHDHEYGQGNDYKRYACDWNQHIEPRATGVG